MKKSFLLFISPLLTIFCSLIIWLVGSGGIVLSVWMLRDLCIPIIHFTIVSHFINKYSYKNSKIIFAVLLYFVVIVVNIVLLGLIAKNGRLIFFYSVFDILWSMICGFVIIGHNIIVRSNLSKRFIAGIITAEALVALTVNAMLTWFLTPILATSFAIDDVEILMLPLSAFLLCLFSYLLGVTLTDHNIVWKLFAWFLGIMTSVFISLWLIGSPHILPFTDYTLTIIWIVASLIIFTCSCVGVVQRKKNICSSKLCAENGFGKKE